MLSILSLNSVSKMSSGAVDAETALYSSFPSICWTTNTDALVSFTDGQYKNYGKKLTTPNTVTLVNTNNVFSFDETNVRFGSHSLKQVINATSENNLSIDNFVMKTTTGFSASFWFRYTSLHATQQANIFSTDYFTNNIINNTAVGMVISAANEAYIYMGVKKPATSYTVCFQAITLSTYGISNNGAWNHIGYSISTTGVVILVINGTNVAWTGGTVIYLQSQAPGANVHLADNIKSYNFRVGSKVGMQYCRMNGNVDQLRLYNATLTVAQIQDLYNNRC